jgi:hypothetical protein
VFPRLTMPMGPLLPSVRRGMAAAIIPARRRWKYSGGGPDLARSVMVAFSRRKAMLGWAGCLLVKGVESRPAQAPRFEESVVRQCWSRRKGVAHRARSVRPQHVSRSHAPLTRRGCDGHELL